MKFKNVKQAGFSLVELMVVVGIIGILAAIAVPKLQRFTAKAKQAEAKTELRTIDSMYQSYFSENSSYNATLATVGYSATTGTKTYTAPIVAATSDTAYTVQMTSRKKLCGSANNTDQWQIVESGTLTNPNDGTTGC